MPYPAQVFRVAIASPGDVSEEREVARRVIHEWNSAHSYARHMVLLPVGWETDSAPLLGDRAQEIINTQLIRNADLLIAIFWTRLGSPTGVTSSGTVEEIEEFVSAGRPVMIYFSAAPVRPDSVDGNQYTALKEFKRRCQTIGLTGTYDAVGEFRERLTRDLANLLNTHAAFAGTVAATISSPPSAQSAIPLLSAEAQQLLIAAAHDKTGVILRVRRLVGTAVRVSDVDYVKSDSPREAAIWSAAVDELTELGLIVDRSGKGEAFVMTSRGFQVADLIGAAK